MSMTEDSLEHYLEGLRHFRDERAAREEASFGDGFAILGLKIVTLLLEDNELGRTIAKELSLIIDLKEPPRTEHELLAAVSDIEQDLEENLRGFSGLLDLILEDTHIRRDPVERLHAIENFDPKLASSFSRLTHALMALMDFEEAFVLDFPRAATTIFLMILKDIKRDLFAIDDKKAELAIVRWLNDRIKNSAMGKLFEQGIALSKCSITEFDGVFNNPDLVVVTLCLWSVDQHMLNREEAVFIDRILCSMGMLGIKPLVEAGFLDLDECARGDMLKNISPKILLAT